MQNKNKNTVARVSSTRDARVLSYLNWNLDESKEESVDGEEVGEDADEVDEDAVADKEVDLPPGLPHVQTIDIFLQYETNFMSHLILICWYAIP